MSGCEATRRLIAACLDGELLDDERRSVEEHLRDCAPCRDAFAAESALHSALRAAVPRHEAPPELRARVETLLAPRRRLAGRLALAALGAAAAVMAVLWLPTRREPPAPLTAATPTPERELISVAVDTHLRYARGQLPLEVRSERPEAVSGWFSGRVPFEVKLPDYPVGPGERKFYTLEGGRLVSLAGDYGAYVAYRMDGKPISLLVASADKVKPSGRGTVKSGSLTFHLESVAGLEVITWTDKGLTYALASDLSVSGERSCLVCHGSPQDRGKIEGFAPRS